MWFFNRGNSLKRGVQAVNLLALTVATYDLMTNPNSKFSENGLEIMTNVMSYLCLFENTSFINRFVVSGFNKMRVGAIYAGVTSGCSETSLGLSAVKAVAQLVTSGTLLFASDEEEENQARARVGVN